jgi:hypothetical protein
VVGQLRLLKNDEAKFADNTINSSPSTAPSWLRPADPAQKIPIYEDGFGPITLTAVGGAYEDPNRAWPDPAVNPRYPLILGLPNRADNRDNAMIEFNVDSVAIGHIGGSSNLPTLYTDSLPQIYSTDAIDVTEGSKVTVPKPGSIDNPYGTTLSVVPKTGMFRGKLMLEGYDNDELTARRTTYQGIIVQTAEGLRGVGYYLVANRLPEVTDNKKTLPQVSDQVYFAPYTPPVVEPDPEPTP